MYGRLGLAVPHEDRCVEIVQHRVALRDPDSLRDRVDALRCREDKTILTANRSQLRGKVRAQDQGSFIEDYACERRRLPPLLYGIKEQLRRQAKKKRAKSGSAKAFTDTTAS